MHKLEILNSIEVTEYDADGSVLIYCLVKNTQENRQKLMDIGVPTEEIDEMVSNDLEEIDISGFGFRYGGAKWFHPDLGGWLDFVPREESA